METDIGVLYVAVAGAFAVLLCSACTILRFLLPLLSASTASTCPAAERPRLKSAQRFAMWLAFGDLVAFGILLWEAVVATCAHRALGTSGPGTARLVIATTLRPTLLLIVAVLSYLNVVRGRAVPVSKVDCLLWLPTVVLCAPGSALASRTDDASHSPWIGLLSWLTIATVITAGCFGRLLLAILRVRRLSEAPSESNRVPPNSAKFLDTFWPNTSDLSTSFVRTIGRISTSSAVPSFPLSFATGPEGFRPSFEADPFARSPTPGSTRRLLGRSASSSPYSLRPGPGNDREGHDVLTFEEIEPREVRTQMVPDMGSARELGSRPPQVELSAQEAFGAVVRVGGHLASAAISYALTAPFVACRSIGSSPSAAASYLLILGACLPSVFLAWQITASEGIWFKSTRPRVRSSAGSTASRSNADNAYVDMQERSASRASTVGTYKDCVVGIRPDGVNCSPTPRGTLGRAVSILSAHPKLQLLPQHHARTTSVSTATRPLAHTRLRSLHLPKLSRRRSNDMKPPSMPPRCATPATLAGHEVGAISTPRVTQQDTMIALSLLRSQKARSLYLKTSANAGTLLGASELGVLDPPTDNDAGVDEVRSHPKETVEIDALAARILPQLVPSLKIGSGVQIAPNSSLSDRRRSLPTAAVLDAPALQSSRRRSTLLRLAPKRNRSLPALSFTPPQPELESDAGPPTQRFRRKSGAASVPPEADHAHHRERTETESSVSGFVLLHDNNTDGSDDSSSEEDPRTGTIHCATLRPVSRVSSASFYGPSLSRHVPALSTDTAISLATTSESSAASLTFPDRLSWGVWQDRAIVFDSDLARRLSGSSASIAPFTASPQQRDVPRPASWASSTCESLESSFASAERDVYDSPSYRLSAISRRDSVEVTDENRRVAAAPSPSRRRRQLPTLSSSPMRKMR